MNKELDITNLINKTQDFVHNGMIEFASSGSTPIQDIQIGDDVYELRVSLSIKRDDGKTTDLYKAPFKYIDHEEFECIKDANNGTVMTFFGAGGPGFIKKKKAFGQYVCNLLNINIKS
jgi:hypothetical protein